MISEEIAQIIRNEDLNDDLKKLLLEDHLKRRLEDRQEAKPVVRSLLGNGPLLAVLASVTAALVSGGFAFVSAQNQTTAGQLLERQKFEYELVTTALSEQKTAEERKKTLAFFQSIGLFQLLRIEDVPEAEIPAIGINGATLFAVETLYPETVATIQLILDEPRISADLKSWKKFWHLYRVDLIGVESQAVARAMIAFGRELTVLSETGLGPSAQLRDLGRAVVEEMAKEVPALVAALPKFGD